ncbi:MAG: sensor histidine kinase [Candidatus Hydrogenedentes bacterium]|nr:sensor histidine kinase [Candidatus Hydrogenedentota bacterium]
MKIKLDKAIAYFYPSPSFEQIYFETIANAIDAGATEVSIDIYIESFAKPETLSITIKDNGVGFTDRNFGKFSHLLDADSKDHKGLGRLVLLVYFSDVHVSSVFGKSNRREFDFTRDFGGEEKTTSLEGNESANGTTIKCESFLGERIKSYDYLRPSTIRERLLEHFFPLFFHKKQGKEELSIKIRLDTKTPNQEHNFYNSTSNLTLSDVPELTAVDFKDDSIDLIENITVHYRIDNDKLAPKSVLTAFCVDGRTIKELLVPLTSIPEGHQLVFLFTSNLFSSTDASRQSIDLTRLPEKPLMAALRRQVASIIDQSISEVQERNVEIDRNIREKFPHLAGYFPTDTIGIIQREDAIEQAQRQFFLDQKDVLECTELDEKQYEKALNISARVLTEYILHRVQIIRRLKSISHENSESDIHNLIVPMRQTLRRDGAMADIYNNNIWVFDDKYMSYSTILSDESMEKVLSEITLEVEASDGRPDLTIVFSGDPATSPKVDVVLIELKKLGVSLAQKEEVVSQLRQRARRLLEYFPDRINRIWFYGLTEIDDEFRRSLMENDFQELYSLGTMFYKPQDIYPFNKDEKFIVDMYVMTYDTLLRDAESRNSTFLNLLKYRIQNPGLQQEYTPPQ